ncbi:ABC transporter substrate-binding protein [Kordia sp. YSTF-M3]|uniref:ABC transporter substrate-binding protein n=1 Tax=Kordia aestuariivivens TaxID=2759037 RepID=A0ABR7QE39_9FLAO|nr:helical backbone metal receptor [Kordia aestuariivivens]MBC8756589.1 ABC transporter substrate-binding protein [Kordia aestuariivivens]
MEFTDQMQRTFTLETTPKRIVSLVPSQTELLYDLGLEDSIVGITKFCVHPYHLKSTKTIVGGTKNIKLAKIIALQPDIILCNKEENTKEIVEELEKLYPVHVSDIQNIDESLEMITQYGTIFKCNTEASKINDKIRFHLKDFQEFVKDIPVQKVAYFIWRKPWMAAGKDTFINYLLKLCKFENIYESHGRYPEVEIKKIRLQGDPAIVMLSSEPYPFKSAHAFELGRHTHHAKTVFVDGEYFSWYGSRLSKAFAYFKQLHKSL